MTTLDLEGVRAKIRRNMPLDLRTPVDPLTWILVGEKDSPEAFLQSRCGGYTVTRALCEVSEKGSTRRWMYFAWRVPPARMKDGLAVMAEQLGARLRDSDAAKALCDADWKKNGGVKRGTSSAQE